MAHANKTELETEIGDLAALAAAAILERIRAGKIGKPNNWKVYGGMMLRCLTECRLEKEFDLDFRATVMDQAPELLKTLYPGIPDELVSELLDEVVTTVDSITKRFVN